MAGFSTGFAGSSGYKEPTFNFAGQRKQYESVYPVDRKYEADVMVNKEMKILLFMDE